MVRIFSAVKDRFHLLPNENILNMDKNIYSGAPLIRPPLDQNILAVIMGWLY